VKTRKSQNKIEEAKQEVHEENISLGTGNIDYEEMKSPSEIIELDIGGYT
jgi:hypothetical protein